MDRGLPVQLRLKGQNVLEVRVMRECDELFEDVAGHHALLLAEDGEALRLAPVVSQELVEILGHNGRPVLAVELAARGLEGIRLSEAERGLLQKLEDQLDLSGVVLGVVKVAQPLEDAMQVDGECLGKFHVMLFIPFLKVQPHLSSLILAQLKAALNQLDDFVLEHVRSLPTLRSSFGQLLRIALVMIGLISHWAVAFGQRLFILGYS